MKMALCVLHLDLLWRLVLVILSNNIEIKNEAIAYNLKRLTNQIYKLLPNREENID